LGQQHILMCVFLHDCVGLGLGVDGCVCVCINLHDCEYI